MTNRATWKVLAWDEPHTVHQHIPLDCDHCGREADCPMGDFGAAIIAAKGLSIITDPRPLPFQPNVMPNVIQCRKCRHVFRSSDVR